MSTLRATNIKHESSATNQIVLGADGSIGGTLGDTLAAKLDASTPIGKILQVVMGTTWTSVTNNTSTWADTGLTATITPSSSSSRIIALVSQNGVLKINSTRTEIQLLRGATPLAIAYMATETNTAAWNGASVSLSYFDSPSTTSATTYKTQQRSSANVATSVTQYSSDNSTLILMEVAA